MFVASLLVVLLIREPAVEQAEGERFSLAGSFRALLANMKDVFAGEKSLLGPGLHWSLPYPIDEFIKVPITSVQRARSQVGWYFAPPGAEVIVLQNQHLLEGGGDLNFEALAAACGHAATTIGCMPVRVGPGERAIDADLTVDCDALVTALHKRSSPEHTAHA